MKTDPIRERVFAEELLKGKSQTEAAKIASPHLTKKSAAMVGSRLAKRQSVQQLIDKALKKHDITILKAIGPIADALQATKIVTSHTEPDYEIIDHPVRLKASSMALDLLGAKKTKDQPQTPPASLNNEELSQALKTNDAVELQRILFKKQDTN